MGHIFRITGALLATLALGISQAGRQEMDRNSKAEHQLVRMEHELAEAANRRDITTLERLTADDFVGFDPSGQELNKAKESPGSSSAAVLRRQLWLGRDDGRGGPHL